MRKKCILTLMLFLLSIIGVDSRRAGAYSVTVQKDGLYGDVIPDLFVNHTDEIFQKYVEETMEYYNKYKDADDYTYIKEVPEGYRDFIPIAKQIQDSDEVIIRNPFCIYWPNHDESEYEEYYHFFAEKNGKKLCMFSIHLDTGTKELSFEYNKMEDGHFVYDETTGESVFYQIKDITYAETEDKTNVIWDKTTPEGESMIPMGESVDWEAELDTVYQKFKEKSYREKKDEILAYLAKVKKGKFYKQVEGNVENKLEKNLKLEIEDEFAEPEKDARQSSRTGIYIVIGIIVVGVITGGMILLKKRKKE